MTTLPSGTVTFLFTDIVGSTRLWDEHPDAMRVALARHDHIIRDVISSHSGCVFSTGGDGVGAAFQRAGDAIAAALASQRAFRIEPWPESAPLQVRMGAHTGECQERDGDYFGPPVNCAARVMAVAGGNQIVLTRTTAEVAERLPDVRFLDLGLHTLKGLVAPMHLVTVQADGVVTAEPLRTSRAVLGNLPRPATEYVGRVDRLQRQVDELRRRRVVTLTGTGGVGKTRAAIEIGGLVSESFPDGVVFVELAPVSDPASVVATVAATLAISTQDGMTLTESVVDWLRGRNLLLIVDNCEHVIAPVAALVALIAASCPTVGVLMTSREPLAVAGEHIHSLPSLDPDVSGPQLFLERASSADDSFDPELADRAVITGICRRLDGIPLAIELAAARIRSLTPAELLGRLDDRFRLLRGSGRGGLERHQTLRATVDWSYQLLSVSEQLLFDRASVFAGGFDIRAAESVCADESLDPFDVLDVLANLVGKSMMNADRSGGTTRYRLLETLRQYGEESLERRGQIASLRDRHLRHYVGVAETADELVTSPRQADGDAIFEREWDNLRAGHIWAVATADSANAEAILVASASHALNALRHEHYEWAERTLTLDSPERPVRPAVFAHAAHWCSISGDNQRAIEFAHQGIARAPDPDHPDTAGCWLALVNAHHYSARPAEAEAAAAHARITSAGHPNRLLEWSSLIFPIQRSFATGIAATEDIDRLRNLTENLGVPRLLAHCRFMQGLNSLYLDPPDYQAALALYRNGIDLARASSAVVAEGLNLAGAAQAMNALDLPDTDAACTDTLRFLHTHRLWSHVWVFMVTIASRLASTERIHPASVLLGNLEAHHPPLTAQFTQRQRSQALEQVRKHQQAQEWMAEGAGLDRDQVVAYALQQLQ